MSTRMSARARAALPGVILIGRFQTHIMFQISISSSSKFFFILFSFMIVLPFSNPGVPPFVDDKIQVIHLCSRPLLTLKLPIFNGNPLYSSCFKCVCTVCVCCVCTCVYIPLRCTCTVSEVWSWSEYSICYLSLNHRCAQSSCFKVGVWAH